MTTPQWLSVEPTEFPLSLADTKHFLRVTHTHDDDLILSLIASATRELEKYTGQVFITRIVEGYFGMLYTSKYNVYPYVKLLRAPLIDVTSVDVTIDDIWTAVDDYQVEKHADGYSRIMFPGFNYNLDDTAYPLRIIFTAGYGDATTVPSHIKTAIKMRVNDLYRNRGDCDDGNGLSATVKSLLAPYKIIEVYA